MSGAKNKKPTWNDLKRTIGGLDLNWGWGVSSDMGELMAEYGFAEK
jgi:hypothetical protein